MRSKLDGLIIAINSTKVKSYWVAVLLRVLRACVIALLFVSIWELIRPNQQTELMFLMFLAVTMSLALSNWRRPSKTTRDEVLLHLEMTHPEVKNSPFSLRSARVTMEAEQSWQPHIAQLLQSLHHFERRMLAVTATTLVLPTLLLGIIFIQAPSSLSQAFSSVTHVVQRLNWGAKLEIVDGHTTEEQRKASFALNPNQPTEIELLERNMIKVSLVGSREDTSGNIALLKRIDNNELYQSFQLTETAASRQSTSKSGEFQVSFAVTEQVQLYVPAISQQPLAIISVQKLPVPEVSLELTATLVEPWPDEEPLPLRINVTAESAIQLVRLVVVSGSRESSELVANVMAEDRKELTSNYEILLQPYVESDIADVEIYAEAIDRSLPQPLLGRSEPLIIRTASAYGRYQQTLRQLHAVKTELDQLVEEAEPEMPPEINEMMREVMSSAQRSPFFDGLDRVEIAKFQSTFRQLTTDPNKATMLQLSTELNEFLFEHEAINDRERDRDFFVAARGLSRLLEQDRRERPVTVPVVAERISSFLDQRMQRWQLRVEHLNVAPKSWEDIRNNRPFHQGISDIVAQDAAETREQDAEALITLSQLVTDYRTWLDELEAAEDADRQQREQERQEGLSSARNQLREIQQRQDEISRRLDDAINQDQEQLANQWPSTRMQQQSNVNETRRLENQLRSLSPQAGERIQLAQEMMELAMQAGNQGDFNLAESGADRAARFLRQAESAARQAQNRRQDRGRRRRVTGDNYFGSTIAGELDIRREYRVDERYRERILEDIRDTISRDPDQRSEDRRLLEGYLRQLIR